MSEAASPNKDPQPAPGPSHSPAAAPSKASDSRGGAPFALVALALLVGAGGLAAGGWSFWRLQGLQDSLQSQNSRFESGIRSQLDSLVQSDQRLRASLDQLPGSAELDEQRRILGMLQGDQQRMSQRLDTVLGGSRKEWRLAEAEHLLRLASLRLSALQDVNSARALVEGADEILREQDDPASFAARQQLAKAVEALRSVQQPDRTGLFLKLGALREQVAQLQPLAPIFQQEQAPAVAGRWQQWWEKISRFVRIDLHADQDIRPLLSGQNLSQVRLTLDLALEQAQWAALHAQPEVYRQALKEAQDVLAGQFNTDHPQSAALLKRLAELAEQPVAVQAPDLAPALATLQTYLQRRQALEQPQADGSAAGEGQEARP